jgi:hypothetical protein
MIKKIQTVGDQNERKQCQGKEEIHFTVDNFRQTAILSLIVYANSAA